LLRFGSFCAPFTDRKRTEAFSFNAPAGEPKTHPH
jgi:hypothetical protein